MISNSPYKKFRLVCVLLLVSFVSAFAGGHSEGGEKEKFNVREFIFGHIGDSYSWHITKIGDTHLNIPLPIIVQSQDGSWHTFMSSIFHHEELYEGFYLGENGKVMEKLSDGTSVRPFDLSITKNVLSLLISAFLLIWFFLSMAHMYKKETMYVPGGFRGIMEVVMLFVLNEVIKPCVGKDYARYAPYLLTLFFFVLINNVMGIIPIFPGGANVTGNIAITGVLALFSFIAINLFASREYWREIFWGDVPVWLKSPIFPLIPLLEFIGIFTKPMALMIRLFANILAGHIIQLVFIALIFIFGAMSVWVGTGVSIFSVAFAVVMFVLEILVVFIQAFVFTMLTSVFIGLSRVEPHHAHQKH